jgi:hypothetical protein
MRANYPEVFTTGIEYVEYIHRIPASERRWYHHSYLWYHRNAKIILLSLAICAVIYSAIMYRSLLSVARPRSNSYRMVMTGGVLTPSQIADEQLKAQILQDRIKAEIKHDRQITEGKKPRFMAKGAFKNYKAAGAKISAAGTKISESAKNLKADFKSGKLKAQTKLMAQQAGARIHDEVKQNAGSVYTIIFSLFLFSGVALYFIPTIGMIGIGILTFYMFSDFVRGVITL